MPQVSLYLDDATHATMVERAKQAGLSQSRWVANLIREQSSEYRQAVFRSLAGCWPDAPDPAELRHVAAEDVPREEF